MAVLECGKGILSWHTRDVLPLAEHTAQLGKERRRELYQEVKKQFGRV